MTLRIAATSGFDRETHGVLASFRARGVEAEAADPVGGDPLVALREGRAACALVSAEGVPSRPAELHLAAVIPRDEPRDVLVPGRAGAAALDTLPAGTRVGAGTALRRSFLRAHRPDLVPVAPGNGGGPAEALRSGSVDAVVLGNAEARRLALGADVTEVFDARAWVPAPGQGTLLLLCRSDDAPSVTACADLDDAGARATFRAEAATSRAQGLEGDVALGVMAILHGSWIRVWGMAASEDGRQVVRGDVTGRADDPEGAGRALADLLVARGVGDVLRGVPR